MNVISYNSLLRKMAQVLRPEEMREDDTERDQAVDASADTDAGADAPKTTMADKLKLFSGLILITAVVDLTLRTLRRRKAA